MTDHVHVDLAHQPVVHRHVGGEHRLGVSSRVITGELPSTDDSAGGFDDLFDLRRLVTSIHQGSDTAKAGATT